MGLETKILKVDPQNPKKEHIKEAVAYLNEGKIVCLPTETVYGLSCNYLSQEARDRIFEIKQRPGDKPLVIAVYNELLMENFVMPLPLWAYKISENFLPGPVTMVIRSYEGEEMAFRMPDSPVCLAILEEFGQPVWLTSANKSGKPECFSVEEVISQLPGAIDLIVDTGPTRLRQPSTVVKMEDGRVQVVREGPVSQIEIERAVSSLNIIFVCTGNSCRSAMAQAILDKYVKELRPDLKGKVKASSCGVGVIIEGSSASPPSRMLLLNEEGIDFSRHRTRMCYLKDLKRQDLIFVAQEYHLGYIKDNYPYLKDRVHLLLEFADLKFNDTYDIPDPIGRSDAYYYEIYSLIKEAVKKTISKL